MSDPHPIAGTITLLLNDARSGSADAADRLARLVYDELRGLARKHLRGRRDGLLTPTALVNSAFERLLGREALTAENRRHFFFLFSRALGDIVTEHVRQQRALKRGGGRRPAPLTDITIEVTDSPVDVCDLHEALQALDQIDAEAAAIVRLRFFNSMTSEQAAECLGCTPSAARKHWDYARAWLHDRLSGTNGTT